MTKQITLENDDKIWTMKEMRQVVNRMKMQDWFDAEGKKLCQFLANSYDDTFLKEDTP